MTSEVEVYFEVELSDTEVRVWVEAGQYLVGGVPQSSSTYEANRIREHLKGPLFREDGSYIANWLQTQNPVSAFQINDKEKEKVGLVWYRDWP